MIDPSNTSSVADWRRRAVYGYTAALPRRAWAWEFLRRNSDYRRAWTDASATVAIETPAPNLTVMTAGAELRHMAHWGLFFRRRA